MCIHNVSILMNIFVNVGYLPTLWNLEVVVTIYIPQAHIQVLIAN